MSTHLALGIWILQHTWGQSTRLSREGGRLKKHLLQFIHVCLSNAPTQTNRKIGVHTKESFLIRGRSRYWLLTCTVYLTFLSESIPMTGITNTCHGGGPWFCHCISTLPTYTVPPVNVLEMSHQKGSKVRCMNLSHLYVGAGWKQSWAPSWNLLWISFFKCSCSSDDKIRTLPLITNSCIHTLPSSAWDSGVAVITGHG